MERLLQKFTVKPDSDDKVYADLLSNSIQGSYYSGRVTLYRDGRTRGVILEDEIAPEDIGKEFTIEVYDYVYPDFSLLGSKKWNDIRDNIFLIMPFPTPDLQTKVWTALRREGGYSTVDMEKDSLAPVISWLERILTHKSSEKFGLVILTEKKLADDYPEWEKIQAFSKDRGIEATNAVWGDDDNKTLVGEMLLEAKKFLDSNPDFK